MADKDIHVPVEDDAKSKADRAVRKILKFGKENGFSIYQPDELKKWFKFSRNRGVKLGVDPTRMSKTMERANGGDPKAIEAIRLRIECHFSAGEPPPRIFVDYLSKNYIKPPSIERYAARKAGTNHRDYYIAWAVQEATRCGLKLCRGDSIKISQPDKTSACSLVASVFAEFSKTSIDEDRVLRIANKWRKKPPFLVGKMKASEYR